MRRASPKPENRTIRILQILEATTGGTRQHLYYLLKHLDRRRFSITLAYANRRDQHFAADLDFFASLGIELVEAPMKREIAPWSDWRAGLALYRLMRRNRYDVVHAHSSKAGFLGRLAARAAGVPAIVYSPHSFAFQYCPHSVKGILYRALERFAGLFHQQLLCVSQGERAVALKHRICPPAKIHTIIANVIPLDEWRPRRERPDAKRRLGLPAEEPVVGMVAHFRPQKGYRHFIEAMPEILRRAPAAKFLIVGDGPLLPKAREQIQQLGIADSVILAGHQEQPLDYYQAMDVFVLSSLWEGMPYVILEAMALGLPIVASDTVGNNELVQDGENGFLTRPGSSAEIADRVAQLLEDESLRRACGRHSRRAIEQMPTMDDWIEQYESFYTNLLSREPSSASALAASPSTE